jgi:macrolide-specific efflux system membrane fusion protein
MKPTMSVSAIISVSEKENVIMVSSSAIKSGMNGEYVEVLENGMPKRVIITTGDSNDTSTEILSGVTAGDKVITQTVEISGDAKSSATTSSSTKSGGSSVRGMSGMGVMGGSGPPR